ncbi:MAG: SGNH/GDSL hydrolase family protein [Candidatus Obscuribacterales bacterium]|nr:SGNH/GDSL hydrolase family protein [Candidatus Obscuribacterales bacterium]
MQKTLTPKANANTHPEANEDLPRPWWQSCLIYGAFLCLGIIALEAYFNFAGVGNEEFLEPDKSLGIRHIPGKKVVWRLEGYSDEYLSKQGLRDSFHEIAKPDNTFRIALLGDSATEGMQVPLNDTYGKQLEKMLSQKAKNSKIEVINFGCSSYSNGQETLQLEQQVKAFKPDLVIMMYNRGDYLENIRDPSTLKAEPRPYFHMNESGTKLLQDNTIMEVNKDSFEPNPTIDFLRRNSRIYGVLGHMNLALTLNEKLYSKIKGTVMSWLPQTRKSWKNVQAAYTIADPWKVTESIIDRAQADCKAMNSRFMLVCFPNIVKDPEYQKQIETLKAESKLKGYEYLDLTPAYSGSKDANSLFLKYHFSSKGHELAAREIANLQTSIVK